LKLGHAICYAEIRESVRKYIMLACMSCAADRRAQAKKGESQNEREKPIGNYSLKNCLNLRENSPSRRTAPADPQETRGKPNSALWKNSDSPGKRPFCRWGATGILPVLAAG
jgi:hypothetical protein